MSWLREHDFNAVRLLFNHEMILDNPKLEAPEALELAGYKYLPMFRKIGVPQRPLGTRGVADVTLAFDCVRRQPRSLPRVASSC
jgi:hypothetical protein